MAQNRSDDLGREKVGTLLFRLALPAITAQLINMLYNIVDRIYIALVLTAVFLLFGRQLLMMFGASEQTVPYALSYMNIYVSGTLFVQLSLGLNAFITGQGFAKTGMATVAIGAVINILLDPLFIFVFRMGVAGAAWATVISQAVSCVWVVAFLAGKKTQLHLWRKNLRLRGKVLFPVLALGVSPFIMQSTESLLSIVLNTSLLKYGGDPAVGAMTIMTSVMQILNLPLMGLAQGAQPIIGYNFGAGATARVKKAFRLLFLCSLSYAGAFWALMIFCPQLLVGLFSGDKQLVEFTHWACQIYFAVAFMLGIQMSCQQTFVAVGQAKSSLFLALLRKIILLIPLIYI
ncbi:MAG: MATE family efflux transporter, partial [Oscillospiraceae bacterium]|nr:MATE family efflux transporter [Oscillospiraceae bacterium]